MPDWPASRELPIIYMFCGATQHSNTEPFDKTSPYAYLHICGTPWAGNEYTPNRVPVRTMRYRPPTVPPANSPRP